VAVPGDQEPEEQPTVGSSAVGPPPAGLRCRAVTPPEKLRTELERLRDRGYTFKQAWRPAVNAALRDENVHVAVFWRRAWREQRLIEMRLRDHTTLTPADFYASGMEGRLSLIDLAAEVLSLVEVLDEFDEDWRTRYARDPAYRVVDDGPGGERAIVKR
jgi:hypothetical protein